MGKITSTGNLSTKGDCFVGRKLTAKRVDANDLKATELSVVKNLSSGSITSKGTISAAKIEVAIVESNEVIVKSLFVTEIEAVEKLETLNINVKESMSVGSGLLVKGSIEGEGLIKAKEMETEESFR